jgi:hypothetical protein
MTEELQTPSPDDALQRGEVALADCPENRRTLLVEMQRMTPEERLQWNDGVIRLIEELRRGMG